MRQSNEDWSDDHGENPREEQYYYDHPEEVEERVELVSNCCGEPMNGYWLEYDICPSCGERCERINLLDEQG